MVNSAFKEFLGYPSRIASSIVFFALFLSLRAGFGLYAQESSARLTGGLDSSLNVILDPSQQDILSSTTTLGLILGKLGLTAGGREVKTELRLTLTNHPKPEIDLERAWIKFRFPGWRGTLGWGRLGWGPGVVYAPGDLLFDSTSLSLDFAGEEWRSNGAWLADGYWGWGEEAFAEALIRVPALRVDTVGGAGFPQPSLASAFAGGWRISAVIEKLGWEAAYAADGENRLHKAALSVQFPAGLDWYLSARQDLSFEGGTVSQWLRGLSFGFGGFGIGELGDGLGFSTRHEALLRPWHHWQSVDLRTLGTVSKPRWDSDSPLGTSGAGLPYAVYSYHDFSLVLPDHWSLSYRLLLSPVDPSTLVIGELAWAPLQGLRLYLRTLVQWGSESATYIWNRPGAIVLTAGALSTW